MKDVAVLRVMGNFYHNPNWDFEINILSALTCLLKMIAETDKLSKLPLEQWLTYSATQEKCSEEADVSIKS